MRSAVTARRAGHSTVLRRYSVAFALVALSATVAALLSTSNDSWKDGTRHGRWISVFNGFGRTTSSGSGSDQTITLDPTSARTDTQTHSALTVTVARYHDLVASVQVHTREQLRRGPAGHPRPWEVGWVIWHYSSRKRFYALTLGPQGWILSKQDPAYPGGQRFLATGETPRFEVGTTHKAGIVQIGARITVSGDGQLLTHFTDTERPYLSGAFGVYTEDAEVGFSRIEVSGLPTAPRQP